MIPISHTQARRLIRQALNARLPERQWAALQAHLEACPECSAYRQARLDMERRVQRVLHRRWAPQEGLHETSLAELRARRQRKRALQALAGRAAAALAVILLLALLFNRRAGPPLEQPHDPALAAQPSLSAPPVFTPSPTVDPNRFQGLVVLEARRSRPEGGYDGDLLLLTADRHSVEITPLTDGPDHDSDPVWSADGSWIAFLSNQGNPPVEGWPRQDIHVINVAGTRRIRLTNEPDLFFSGPLTWSADGQWLAVQAINRKLARDMLYLVPTGGGALDEPGGRSFGGTLDASRPLFAPQGARLAYMSYNSQTGIGLMQVDLDSGEVSLRASNPQGNRYLTGNFDWSPGGLDLVYSVQAEKVEFHTTRPWGLVPDERASPLAGPLWGPDGNLLYFIDRTLPPYICRTLVPQGEVPPGDAARLPAGLVTVEPSGADPVGMERRIGVRLAQDFCVTGQGPDRSAWSPWTPHGNWLVLTGWPLSALDQLPTPTPLPTPQFYGQDLLIDAPSSIYALRYPLAGPAAAPEAGVLHKLADLPAGYSPGRLAVRPTGPLLYIRPVAAEPEQPQEQPAAAWAETTRRPSADLLGRVVGISESQVLQMVPLENSVETRVVAQVQSFGGNTNERYTDLVISPADGRVAVAYTYTGWRSEVFLHQLGPVPRGQSRMEQITSREQRSYQPDALWEYRRLAWSPDGWQLAALLQAPNEQALQFIDIRRPENNRMVVLTPRMLEPDARPRWTPDGRAVLLGTHANPRELTEVIAVDAATGEVRTLAESAMFDTAASPLLSPSGQALTFFALTTYPLTMNPPQAPFYSLRLVGLASSGPDVSFQLPGYNARFANTGYGWPLMHPDGRLLFLLRAGPTAREKTLLFSKSLGDAGQPPQVITRIRSALLAAAWSPDHHWLIYSTEDGTYLLDLRDPTQPVYLSPVIFSSLDWR